MEVREYYGTPYSCCEPAQGWSPLHFTRVRVGPNVFTRKGVSVTLVIEGEIIAKVPALLGKAGRLGGVRFPASGMCSGDWIEGLVPSL